MKAFYALVFICLVVMIALTISFGLTIKDYLVTIKILLYDIKGLFYQFRDNSSAILDRLDKEPKEDDPNEDRTGDVWALAPCPECGGPASMHYDHDSGDGYFVVCSKYARHENCRYSIITGGSTRRLAATEWNRNVVDYVRKKVRVEASDD